MSEERWLPIPGYEGLYEVSDLGRVRSLDRVVQRNGGLASGRPMRLRGAIRKLALDSASGYWKTLLYRDGRGTTRSIHSLVAEAFIGPRPAEQEVRHLDGDPRNARLDNLAYGTSVENKADQKRHGTNYFANRTHCPKGHPYSEANTYSPPSRPNARYCRACAQIRRGKVPAQAA